MSKNHQFDENSSLRFKLAHTMKTCWPDESLQNSLLLRKCYTDLKINPLMKIQSCGENLMWWKLTIEMKIYPLDQNHWCDESLSMWLELINTM